MSEDPVTIGIMHPAFQVPKTTLLAWINDFFQLDYKRVEDCATGAVYCQMCDCLFPNSKVAMSTVVWDAKSEYEYVKNWKIVQKAFDRNGVAKPIAIEKLVRAKFQDNLEFLQWFKYFFDCKYANQEYNAKERRKKGKGALGLKSRKVGGAAAPRAAAAPKPAAAAKPTASKKTATSTGAKKTAASSDADSKKIEELKAQITELQTTAVGLEKERDFYYNRLVEVETHCQKLADDSVDTVAVSEILQILYAPDGEGEGEEAAAEDGEEAAAEEEPAAEDEDDTM